MKTKIIALAALLGVSTTQVPLAQATELIGHVQGLNRHSVVAEVPGVVARCDHREAKPINTRSRNA